MRRFGHSCLCLLFLLASGCASTSAIGPVRDRLDAVVTVAAYNPDKAFPSVGGGVLVSPTRVATARHVLAGAALAEVRTRGGAAVGVRGILAENSTMDLVLLELNSPVNARPAPLATSLPEPGDATIAVGSPLGLEWTISVGVVSAVRDVPEAGRVLQHTASVSPGSSGGPLFDRRGRVIAIQTGVITTGDNTMISAGQTLNFAVVSTYISEMKPGPLKSLQQARGEIPAGWLPTVTRNTDLLALRPYTRDDFAGSILRFRERTTQRPDEPDAWFRLGMCLDRTGADAEAIEAYEKAIALKPDHPIALHNLGIVLMRQGKNEQSADALRRSVKADPKYFPAHAHLAEVCVRMKQWDEAITAGRAARRLSPRDVSVLRHLAIAYLNAGRTDKAQELAKALDPIDAAAAKEIRGIIEKKEGKPESKPQASQ